MSPFAAPSGLPLSSDSSSASSAPFVLMSSASEYMRPERLAALTLRSGPTSAVRAAAAARATSSGPASATSQITSPVAGSMVSKVRPSAASICSPPIARRLAPEPTNSRAAGESASAVAVAITGIVVLRLSGRNAAARGLGWVGALRRLGHLALRLEAGNAGGASRHRRARAGRPRWAGGAGRPRRRGRRGGWWARLRRGATDSSGSAHTAGTGGACDPACARRSGHTGHAGHAGRPGVGLVRRRVIARVLAPGSHSVLGDERRVLVIGRWRAPRLDLDGVRAVAHVRDPEAGAACADGAVVGDGAVRGADARGVAGGAGDVVVRGVDLADDLVLEQAAAVEGRLGVERAGGGNRAGPEREGRDGHGKRKDSEEEQPLSSHGACLSLTFRLPRGRTSCGSTRRRRLRHARHWARRSWLGNNDRGRRGEVLLRRWERRPAGRPRG